jgi:hypothetical protein
MLHPIVRRAMIAHPFLRLAFVRNASGDGLSELRSMAPLMNKFLKVSFLEGFLNKQPNTLTNRAASVLSKVLLTLESGGSDPLVDPLLAKGYSADELMSFFGPDNKPYQTAVNALLKTKFRASRVEPYDLMQSLIMGLNPITGDSLARTRGRPLYWFIGHGFAENPRTGSNDLEIQVNSFAKSTLIRYMTDVARGEASVSTVDIDTPIGGTDDGEQATIGDTYAADEDTSFDFMGAMSDRDVQKALNDAIIGRIEARADRAHGNTDAAARRDIEIAIWTAIQSNPDLVTDVDEAYNFSIKQNELGNAVNSLSGLQKAVPYIAKVFRETVANDIKQALASSSVQRILDAKTDIARTYQSDIRRRASRRLIASAKRVAARYAAIR